MYLEYHELLKKYKEASRKFYEALEEGSKLICSVTPGSSQAKAVVVHTNNNSIDDKLINYSDKRSYIDVLINQSRNDMNMMNYQLKKMALELKESSDVKDKIYYYKWIEGRKPRYFNKLIGFSLSRTYDYIAEMKEKLYNNAKSEKIGKK